MAKCVFAGTFDPVTKGHESIIKRLTEFYDSVLVVIGQNKEKICLFTEEQRYNLVKKTFSNTPKVKVIKYSDYGGGYIDYVKENGYTIYARGIRNEIDLQYEKKMEVINKKIYPFFTTVYINADEKTADCSSTVVRQKIANGQDFASLVPCQVYQDIFELIKQKN